MFDDDGFGFAEAAAFGTGYALLANQGDQNRALLRALDRDDDIIHDPVERATQTHPAPVNHITLTRDQILESWDDYVGQQPMKDYLMVSLQSALIRGTALPHVLLASGMPGVGKTTMARLLAKAMGVNIIEIVPPFNIYTLVEAALQLKDRDILFIDEIHKLSDSGQRGAEILLKVLEDKVAYMPDGQVIQLADITIVGATTDKDKLPEPVVDRFKLDPYFQAYSAEELGEICINFAYRHNAENEITDVTALAIADACRGTPRIIEKMVLAARDLALFDGTPPDPERLLTFMEVEPDGLTRTHVHYLTAMRQYFGRENKDGETEYIVGEAAIQQILRETKQGIGRVERFLVERGLLDRTPRGRRLTDAGIQRAEAFIAEGKGARDVA